MRHGKGGNRLSRNQSLRRATLRDLAKATLTEQRICTTHAKAKEARKLIDQLITLGKKDTLSARRRAFAILSDHGVVSRLFKETAPRFKARQGGYTRIIPYMKRIGDNAELAFLELTEKDREIISGLKKVKDQKPKTEDQTAKTAVSDADIKPAASKTGPENKPEQPASPAGKHPQSDVKSIPKAAPKPLGGIRKFFQRKTGGE